MLQHLDLARHVTMEKHGLAGESLPRSQRGVVSREDAFDSRDIDEGIDDLGPRPLETGAHQLHHQPPVVPVADQRGQSIRLAVDDPIGARLSDQRVSPAGGRRDPPPPPGAVDPFTVIALHEAKRDL